MSGKAENGGGLHRWRLIGWGTAATLMLLPLIAMQFTDEVDWGVADFVIFGGMLVAAGIALELAAKVTSSKPYRAASGVALAAAFILIWVNGAVGIIGSEDNPVNLMYIGVLAVGITGAIIARCRPAGMARAMIATAIAQTLVAIIALAAGLGNTFLVTGFFVALWLSSSWLFRKSREEATPQT